MYEQELSNNSGLLKKQSSYMYLSRAVHHHFEATNYASIKSLGEPCFTEEIKKKSFIKLAVCVPIEDWNNVRKKGAGSIQAPFRNSC